MWNKFKISNEAILLSNFLPPAMRHCGKPNGTLTDMENLYSELI